MSHSLNSVNNIKQDSSGNIDIALSSLISSPNDKDVLSIDGSGNAKVTKMATNAGTLGLSCVTASGGWGGTATITNGFQLRMRGNSCTIEQDTSLVTTHTVGSANFIIGWTVSAGKYLFILNNAIDTSGGGSCSAQVYNVATSSYVGPKAHFETGNFSTTITYYANVSTSTRFELRALDVVGNSTTFNSTSHFSCTINVFKV